ncbi:hypothetical protein J0H58_06195 [bacterium]|nr:hypothetical protein [bacterium]
MTAPAPTPPAARRPRITLPFAFVTVVVVGCTVWADAVKYVVTDPADYAYFPPFVPNENRLTTHHLGAEYLEISFALRAGRGFADPFKEESGPTAWMPPVLPFFQAAVLWASDDDFIVLKYVVITLQMLTLVFTGWLVLAGAARVARTRGAVWVAAAAYVALLAHDFRHAFQTTHDTWLIMLALDVLALGFALLPERPAGWRAAAGWGAVGGGVALCGPVLGLVWAVLTALRWPGEWRRWAVAVTAAGGIMLPWAVRNAVVFGRLVPVKSNAFYELYQAQCLTSDGLVGADAGFPTHPWRTPGAERDRYIEVGEMAFLDEKRVIFLAAFRRAPDDFAVRVWNRLAAATVVYMPFSKTELAKQTEAQVLFSDVVHPLPFLALVVLVVAPRRPHRYEWAAACTYVAWLLPYVVVSYYGRYGFPLLGVKAFLCAAAADRILTGLRGGRRLE